MAVPQVTEIIPGFEDFSIKFKRIIESKEWSKHKKILISQKIFLL